MKTAMKCIPDSVSGERLAAFAANAPWQGDDDSTSDLAKQVQYICNDLELILGELDSATFGGVGQHQQRALQGSKTALRIAMHQLRRTTDSRHAKTKQRLRHTA